MANTLLDREGIVFTHTNEMVTVECCNCGCLFGMTKEHNQRCRDDSSNYFYCPNGHHQHYSESTVTKLKKERDRALAQRDTNARWYRLETEEHARTKNQRNAYKGEVTKVKRRVGNGVCPCCNRTFQDLARHMETKHPGYADGDSERTA